MISKLPNVGTTIFSVMSKLAVDHQAINLGQGFPGFQMDMHLGDLVHKYIVKGHNQYAPMPGVPELRKILSAKLYGMYGHSYDPETEITITAGGTQAIFTAITALIREGDEVILFAPAYDCYAPAIELNGGKAIWHNLAYPEYRIDWLEVRKLITDRTKLIIINSPHNPSGTCLSALDIQNLDSIVAETGIFVLSDEVYEHIIFDGRKHESVAKYPALVRHSFIVYSFGKTFHNTGWKMGYICGPANMMVEFRKVHQFNVFSCNTPVQYALAEYMEDSSRYLGLGDFYEAKRNLFNEGLRDSRFRLLPSEGTYFQLLGYEGLFEEKDVDLAVRLVREFGIACIPCSVFFSDPSEEKVLRFCFAKDDDMLLKAGEILSRV